jgi:hypothetical protein
MTRSETGTSNSLPRALKLLGLVLAFGLSACGGGGGGGGSSSAPSGGAALSLATVSFTIHVAPDTTSSSSARTPKYISTAIASVVFVLTAVTPTTGTYTGTLPGAPTIVAIATGGGCTGTVGNYTCTATTTAPAPATDTWTIYTYATATPVVGTTTPLSIYVAYPLAITVAGPNAASVATWGVPATLAFSPAAATGPANVSLTGGNALVTSVVVKDAGAATLLGGNNFSNPTGTAGTVNFTGCAAHLTPTPGTLAAANPTALGAGTLSIAYDGTGAVGTIVCSATAPGGLTASYTVTLTAGTGSVGWTVTNLDRQP